PRLAPEREGLASGGSVDPLAAQAPARVAGRFGKRVGAERGQLRAALFDPFRLARQRIEHALRTAAVPAQRDPIEPARGRLVPLGVAAERDSGPEGGAARRATQDPDLRGIAVSGDHLFDFARLRLAARAAS